MTAITMALDAPVVTMTQTKTVSDLKLVVATLALAASVNFAMALLPTSEEFIASPQEGQTVEEAALAPATPETSTVESAAIADTTTTEENLIASEESAGTAAASDSAITPEESVVTVPTEGAGSITTVLEVSGGTTAEGTPTASSDGTEATNVTTMNAGSEITSDSESLATAASNYDSIGDWLGAIGEKVYDYFLSSPAGIVPLPKEPPDEKVAPPKPALTTGGTNSCFLSRATDMIWCWGGTKTITKEIEILEAPTSTKIIKKLVSETVVVSIPYPVLQKNGQPFRGAIAISAGHVHTCALKNGGTVWCWAAPYNFEYNNQVGQLGDGTNQPSEFPVQVLTAPNKTPLNDIKAIAAGGNHTCALKYDGSLWCWGYNNTGELGNNSRDNSNLAVPVVSPKGQLLFTDVNAGNGFTCAIDTNTALWCWGEALQLKFVGGLNAGRHSIPDPIIDDDKGRQTTQVRRLAHVDTSERLSCFQKNQDNSLWCVGMIVPPHNQNGPFQWPEQIIDENKNPVMVAQASRGGGAYGEVCMLPVGTTSAACFGGNAYGQLGDGTRTDRKFPVQVQDPNGGAFTQLYQIEAGDGFVCSIRLTNNEEVWCWGRNYYGQLGNGTTDNSPLPVRVKLP